MLRVNNERVQLNYYNVHFVKKTEAVRWQLVRSDGLHTNSTSIFTEVGSLTFKIIIDKLTLAVMALNGSYGSGLQFE